MQRKKYLKFFKRLALKICICVRREFSSVFTVGKNVIRPKYVQVLVVVSQQERTCVLMVNRRLS